MRDILAHACAMKRLVRSLVANWIMPFIDPRALASVVRLPWFIRSWHQYRSRSVGEVVRLSDARPCLTDRVAQTPFDPHYFYQAAWLSRRLSDTNPTLHVDVGSSVQMLGVLSAHVPTVFVDYRPLNAQLSRLHPLAATITQLPFATASIGSLSSLHVLEHIGLGRYGDSVDPLGTQLAAAELARVLRPGGRLFVSVPVGRERVCFNAHRIFSPATIRRFFEGLHAARFGLVDDQGEFHAVADPVQADRLDYGCGFFEFVKVTD